MAAPLPTFSFEFHLGDIVVSVVGMILAWVGRQGYKVIAKFLDRVDDLDDRLEKHAGVIDKHSSLFMQMSARHRFEKLSKNRRKDDNPEYVNALD